MLMFACHWVQNDNDSKSIVVQAVLARNGNLIFLKIFASDVIPKFIFPSQLILCNLHTSILFRQLIGNLKDHGHKYPNRIARKICTFNFIYQMRQVLSKQFIHQRLFKKSHPLVLQFNIYLHVQKKYNNDDVNE